MRRTLKQRTGRWLFEHMPISRFLFEQVRTELNAALVAAQNSTLPWRRGRLRELRGRREVYVNVACGPLPLEGFVNLDLHAIAPGVLRWDCRRGVPVSDGAAAGIRVEHFFEHLEMRQEVPRFLRDCYRALRAGGVLRVIVPDAGRFLRAYCAADRSLFNALAVSDPFPADLPTRMDVVSHVFHQGHEHRWGYDAENLTERLRDAGFREVRQAGFGESLDPRLAQDAPKHAPYSLYVEGVK